LISSGRPKSHPALAHLLRHLFLGQAEIVHQLAVGSGLFQRIEVSPLDVLYQCQFQHLLGCGLLDDDRHPGQAGHLGRFPSPLSNDDLILSVGGWVLDAGDDEGLNEAVLANGISQLL
jgi:hypothetical protein